MQTRREILKALGTLAPATMIPHSAPAAPRQTQPSSGGAIVAVVKGKDVDRMVDEALRLIGGLTGLVHDGDKVVIKPNLTIYYSPKDVGSGMTTDVRVVMALVEHVLKQAKCKITFAEGSGRPADVVFEAYGYTKLAKQLGIDLVDLANDKRVPVKIDGLGAKEYSMPVTTLECDVLINVPVLKTHQLTGVTLGMKNLFGLFPNPRGQFHRLVDEHLCDIAGMKKSDLVVVDGIVGMEGQGPLRGTSVKMDLIIASRDLVAVDTVCTAIIGHDPKLVKSLVYAHEKGLGENDLVKIQVKGTLIEKVKRPFKPAIYTIGYSHPKSDEALKKLTSATSFPGTAYTFDPSMSRLNAEKYPLLRSHRFVATVDNESNKIHFVVPCEALLRFAVVEELKSWMQEGVTP